jgi:chemotaxis regulatin CheY-phosphate phosphatase CheZ|tara:strand:- start:376 stop:609 length:234 start_codon:yes stop_codon:yes gene_type:complete
MNRNIEVINAIDEARDVVENLVHDRQSSKIVNALAISHDRVIHLESQVKYLQDKLSEANKSMYQRFKDYIKDRIDRW